MLSGPLQAKSNAVKSSYVQLWAGKAGRTHLKSLNLTEAQRGNPDTILERLIAWTKPKSNELIAASAFRRLEQGSLSVSEYIDKATVLCDQCKYPQEARDRLLRDAIVIGLQSKEAYYRCIEKGSDLTLQEAMTIARNHEDTMKQIDYTRPEFASTATTPEAETHRIQRRKQRTSAARDKQSTRSSCFKCGNEPYHPKAECPAHEATCHRCGKRGHFMKVCKSKVKAKGANVHGLQTEHNGGESDDSDSSNAIYFSADVKAIKKATVHILNNPRHTPHIRPMWLSKDRTSEIYNIDCEVDTGAACNILPLYKARALFGNALEIRAPTLRLLGYDDSPVKNIGSCSVYIYHGNKCSKVQCEIADSRGPFLLGREQAMKMGYVNFPSIQAPPVHARPESTIKIVSTGKTHKLPTTKEYLVKEFADVFSGIGTLPGGDYHIQLKKDNRPVQHPPRQVAISLRPAYKAELERLKELNIITEVAEYTSWVNSIVPVKKADGSLRLCLDPKDLNANIEGNSHYTRTIDDILPELAGAQYLTLLDAKSGYWHVPLDVESSYLTTFNTPWGKFRWLRLPFGLKVSGDEFQSRLDRVLRPLANTTGIADDVLTFGKTEIEHDAAVIKLLETARANQLTFNVKKFHFKSKDCPFFGGNLTPDGYRADPSKIEAIVKMQPPQDLQTLQSFLGLVNYLNRFSPVLAELTAPLRELCKKDTSFAWESSQMDAFQAIKEEITKVPVLAYFDSKKTILIQSDASKKGLGAALLQDGRPVVYASRALTTAEQNYSNIERELLSLVFAAERFHHYIAGSRVEAQTDHKPLESLWKKSISSCPPRLQRLLLRLSQYNLKITYLKGKDNLVADALSRVSPMQCVDDEDNLDIVPVHLLTDDLPADSANIMNFREATADDQTSCILIKTVTDGWPHTRKDCHPLLEPYWNYRDEICVENGLLFKGFRLIIPESLRGKILQTIHQGHFGVEKMQLRARESVFWPNITHDILQIAQQCEVCQKHSRKQQRETLLSHDVPQDPWEKIAIDFFELRSINYMIIADYYSRFPIIRRMRSTTANATIVILKQVFSEYGIPKTLMSDNGPPFSSKEFRDFARKYNFTCINSSPRYPQSNGLIERMVQTVKQCMTRCAEAGDDPYLAMLVYRSTPLTSKIPSPAELLNGRKYRTMLPMRPQRHGTDENYRDEMILEKTRTAERYDRHAKDLDELTKNQKVLVQLDPRKNVWDRATVTNFNSSPRSYDLTTEDGRCYTRNRRYIRPRPYDLRPRINIQRKGDVTLQP